jgi:hypothetical protein
MTEYEETFYHGQLSSKKGVKNDSDQEKSKREERSLPSVKDVVWQIQNK